MEGVKELKSTKIKNQAMCLMNKLITRQLILIFLDISLINLAFIISCHLIFNFKVPQMYIDTYKTTSFLYTTIIISVFYIFKCYKSLWRYASIEEMISVVLSSITSMFSIYAIFCIINIKYPLNFFIINTLIIIGSTGGVRFIYRAIRRLKVRYCTKNNWTKVLIIGGGRAGAVVIKELFNTTEIKKIPVAIVDDDKSKKTRSIHGVPIMGTREDIKDIVKENEIDEIIIAIPSMKRSEKMKLIEICKETKCKLKTLPGLYELIDGRVDIKKIRDVEIEDLLGRDTIDVDLKEISSYLNNQVVLVTGGGGSIGSELCRQIATFKPKRLIILDIYENNAYEIEQELKRKYKDKLNLRTIIASVRDKRRIDEIFKKYNPNVVFHAAAHKHVPLMEGSPTEAIKNNIFGTLNVVELADKYKVKKFVLVSTDKAVNPTNIMGATKRIAEIIIQTMDRHSKTEFVAVRFGNVLGSNGSVIPLFKKQIIEGGPVTVTHPDIIRYFMTIPEAVQLVVQAGAMAKGGEIFVLDMGEPVKIVDLARDLIKLSGFEPDIDIKLEFTGLRPGEKLYEELLMGEEGLRETSHGKIFIGQPVVSDLKGLYQELDMIERIVSNEDYELLDVVIKKLVPGYKVLAG